MSKSYVRTTHVAQRRMQADSRPNFIERNERRVTKQESEAAILQMMLEAELDTVRNSDRQQAAE